MVGTHHRFRADRWLDLWEPAAARMPAFGAKSWSLTRSIDDPLAFLPILPAWHTLVAAE